MKTGELCVFRAPVAHFCWKALDFQNVLPDYSLKIVFCNAKKKKNEKNDCRSFATHHFCSTGTKHTNAMENTIYQFKVTDIEGNTFDFKELKGKKIMIVNTASKCGLTPQYKQLQALYDTYSSEKFVIVGFPANNFMGQEPGTNDEIATFCQRNYGVSSL